jgi:hypothetical protein
MDRSARVTLEVLVVAPQKQIAGADVDHLELGIPLANAAQRGVKIVAFQAHY